MTLTTHAIVGAAVASIVPFDPVLGFTLAFASHFVLDTIPHYDYKIESQSVNPDFGAKMKYDGALLRDFFRIGGDALLGTILAFALFASTQNPWIILLGVVGGMLPDALQFLYMRWKHEPLSTLQRFHYFIHKGSIYFKMNDRPIFGIISQLAFLVAVIFLAKIFL